MLPAPAMARLFEFARRGAAIGKILVYSRGSTQRAATVVCALLMHEFECHFDAALALLEQRRPGCRPSPAHAGALDAWGDAQAYENLAALDTPDYRCLCGAASVSLRRKLHQLGAIPRLCACAPGDPSSGACPAGACRATLQRLNELYGYRADRLAWADLPRSSVARTTFAHTTELDTQPRTPLAKDDARALEADTNAWRRYRCRMCK